MIGLLQPSVRLAAGSSFRLATLLVTRRLAMVVASSVAFAVCLLIAPVAAAVMRMRVHSPQAVIVPNVANGNPGLASTLTALGHLVEVLSALSALRPGPLNTSNATTNLCCWESGDITLALAG